jgi:hypothetical protein
MAQIYCPGGCLLWLGLGAGGTPVFFGTGQGAPEIDVEPEFEPVLNDLGGDRKGFDFSFQGESGVIKYELNRYNEPIYALAQNRPNPAAAAGRGTSAWGAIGTLMIQEGAAYQAWVQFPYGPGGQAAKAGMATLPGGYHFYAVWLAGDRQRGGTKPKVITAIFQAERVFNPATGGFICYDTNMAALAGLAIN